MQSAKQTADYAALFSSANVLRELMLKLNSNPIKITSEFKKIIIMMTITLPMEPYNKLYRPKLLTNAENPMDAMIVSEVAMTAPGDNSFHLFLVDGAYLKIKA